MSRVDVPLLRSQLLAASDVVHGFTTRHGGVSVGALATLNLARRPAERDEHLVENWRRVARALGGGVEDIALLDQVHGSGVAVVEAGAGALKTVAEADGAVTVVPGVLLAVRTADCVPVLLAAPGAVGVAHAGWRGAAAGVVPATVASLCRVAGCAPDAVRAAVGPSVSGAAYEVGEEVVEALLATGVPSEVVVTASPGPRPHVDVGAAVVWQLHRAGVRSVERLDRCTSGPDFFSHRHDGPDTGRQAGVIGRCG